MANKRGYLASGAMILKCWDFGKESCSVGKCKEPNNQHRINPNTQKFEAERRATEGYKNKPSDSSSKSNKKKKHERKKLVSRRLGIAMAW
jgi:hypothetical protein